MTDTLTTTTRPLGRAALALHALAADEDSRPVLARVQVQGGKAYAADGFMAGIVTLPDLDASEAEPEPFGIPRETAKKALTRTSARKTAATVERLDDERLLLTGEAKPDEPIAGTADTEGTYPDLEKMITPTKAPRAFVRLDVDRLKQLVAFLDTALGAAEKHEARVVELRLHTPDAMTEWRAIASDGAQVTAILMPMIYDREENDGWIFDPVEEETSDD